MAKQGLNVKSNVANRLFPHESKTAYNTGRAKPRAQNNLVREEHIGEQNKLDIGAYRLPCACGETFQGVASTEALT